MYYISNNIIVGGTLYGTVKKWSYTIKQKTPEHHKLNPHNSSDTSSRVKDEAPRCLGDMLGSLACRCSHIG